MLSAPIIIFYSFLVLVVFFIGVAPSGLWNRLGVSVGGAAARARHSRAANHFARATASAAFTADFDYVPAGIAFAFDKSRALLFVAGERLGSPMEALVPLSEFRAHAKGVITGGFTDENYVDLFLLDPALPEWRISCGEDVTSAYAIDRLLSSIGLPEI